MPQQGLFPDHRGRGVPRRLWSEAEDAELRAIAGQTLNGRRLRGWRGDPRGRLHAFALKHGRSYAAVKQRAIRISAQSYLKARGHTDAD